MPRRRKEPHPILRKARYNKSGKLTHRQTWIIKDGSRSVSTGCSGDNLAGAEIKLRDYLIKKHQTKPPSERTADRVVIGDIIAFYVYKKKAMISRMSRNRKYSFLWEVAELNRFWGSKTVSEINEETCLAYGKGRSPSVVRQILCTLRTIVNFAELKDWLDKGGKVIDYALPPKSQSRIHFYTRDEVAKLVRTAYRKRHGGVGLRPYFSTRHLARFILTALYTGTRADRIERASFVKEDGRPWIDLRNGIFYRKAQGEFVPTNKRADPVRIPLPMKTSNPSWTPENPNTHG